MELVHLSEQLIKAEGLICFLLLRFKKSVQEFFDYPIKVQVIDFILGRLSMTFVL